MRILFAGMMMAILISSAATGQSRQAEVVATLDGDDVYKLLEPDQIPAIRQPKFMTGQDADRQMSPDEDVIGVDFNGVRRAYSLWQLDHHEVVNDYYGDTPVGVTW